MCKVNDKTIKRLTPKVIANSNEMKEAIFTIPIYQRLFEWDEDKIVQLLNDLLSAYYKDKQAIYYIGMLTAENGNNNLVDGQQRFVVMMLLGSVMKIYYSEWKEFILISDKSRLIFHARKNDEEYLNYLINMEENSLVNIINECEDGKAHFVNLKMRNGVKAIYNWINDHKENDNEFDENEFCGYVFKNMSLYISQLPENYSKKDLNKYFERMNSAGKNLENYEILKVELLKNYDGDKDQATFIWNIVSDMEKRLIREKQEAKITETVDTRRNRFKDALNSIFNNNVDESLKKLNDYKDEDKEKNNDYENQDNIKSIIDSIKKDIIPNEPKLERNRYGDESILSFTEFLLIVLYIIIDGGNREDITIDAFFDTSKLLETYKKYLIGNNEDKLSTFYINLLKYRLIYDYFIIRKNDNENTKLNYDLENIKDESDMNIKKKFIQYQSMLYAGDTIKTFYRWIAPLMKYIATQDNNHINDLLKFLKTKDNENHKCPELENLQYESNDLGYYLRRLDYYIWEQNEDSSEKDNEITYFNFVRGGRSVEHLHPQNQTNVETWDEKDIHCFGNLFLISSSFNSTQSNDSVNVKFARIKDQINKKNIESLKLYKIFKSCDEQENKWNKEVMKTHEDEMYKILKNSYNN